MRLRILTVGKLKEDYLRDAAADYAKRLRPYAGVEIVEIPGLPDPASSSVQAAAKVREEEAVRLLRRVGPADFLVALAIEGQAMTSEELSAFIRPHYEAGTQLAFAIGGSLGLGRTVLDRARTALSLSPLTFPHGLARVILLEQLYRAMKIIRGETYHK